MPNLERVSTFEVPGDVVELSFVCRDSRKRELVFDLSKPHFGPKERNVYRHTVNLWESAQDIALLSMAFLSVAFNLAAIVAFEGVGVCVIVVSGMVVIFIIFHITLTQ